MFKLFCFIDDQENISGELNEFIETADLLGNDVYLFTNINSDGNHNPSDILYAIDNYCSKEDESTRYLLLTNIENLFSITYRIYHQIFDQFIFIQQPGTKEYLLKDIYFTIASTKVTESERLYKPIYSNVRKLNFEGYSGEIKDYKPLLNVNSAEADEKNAEALLRKYYLISGHYYLFEPIVNGKKVMIDLMDQGDLAEDNIVKEQKFVAHGFALNQYMYEYPREFIWNTLKMIDIDPHKNIAEILEALEVLEKEMKEFYPNVYNMTCCIIDDAAQMVDSREIVRSLLLYTFLMQVTKNENYFNQFIRNSINNEYLTYENRYFIWHQCKRLIFTNRVNSNYETSILMKQLYTNVFDNYVNIFQEELKPIPKEDRNSEFIVIFTIQFLSERHAPTCSTLERCYTIAKLLGKKIILINTREQYTNKGELLIYQPTLGNVFEEYNGNSNYTYKDLQIPYYQPADTMPSLPVIADIIDNIRTWKPTFIFSIGDGSIVADLCGRIVPEASIGVVFSALTTTKATFSVIGRTIAEAEWKDLIKAGYQKENVIESTFTFELHPKKRTITREELHIPKDKFVLVSVGIRLDADINDEFIETIQNTFALGTHIVFAGYFNQYDTYCDKYPELKKNSTYIGYYDDMLALMELCDLYINPKRVGGGFSIIEAFHEGKPGVAIRMGDVAVAGGDDFCVKDYKEMIETIKRYIEDKEFYNIMAQKAIEREKVVTDSALAMEKIIDKIQKSPLFF